MRDYVRKVGLTEKEKIKMSSNNNAGNRMLSKGYGSVSAGAVCTLKTE